MKKQMLIIIILTFSVILSNAQNKDVTIPLIGDKAPSFTAQSTNGKINFPKDYGRNWKIIFAHPKDFTPVCSSEILELAHLQDEYNAINASILVLSTDNMVQHETWKKSLEELNYKGREPVSIKFPLIEDNDYSISKKYGMIHPLSHTAENIRAVFVIDPDNKVRAISFYPMEMGRNIDEIKRSVIALQRIDKEEKNIMTPANWNPGDHVMVPVLTKNEKENIGKPGSEIIQISWFMNFKADEVE